MSMGIRRFRASDAEKASKLIRRCLLEVNSKDYPMESIEKMCKQHSPENLIVISMKQDMYVFVRNNDVLGTGCLVQNWIQTVFVNPDYQGRGIGKKLMVHLEKVMGDRGYVTSIVPSSITAYEFYRKLGYRKTKVINDEDSGRNIIMEKKLRKI
jgi:GNAT superfamily N-acetyltransferase